jgi:hypothetical protein
MHGGPMTLLHRLYISMGVELHFDRFIESPTCMAGPAGAVVAMMRRLLSFLEIQEG